MSMNPSASLQQILRDCHALATTDPHFRQALLEVWKQSSPHDDLKAYESLAHIVGDDGLVRALCTRSDTGDSVVYAHRVFAEVDALARRYTRRPLQAVLEIGPGTNLGALFCFVASGVPYAAGVDVQELPPIAPTFYPTLQSYLACVEGFSWWRYFVTQRFPHVSFPTHKPECSADAILQQIDHRCPVSTMPLPFASDTFDLIYSVSALEHVPEPEAMLQEIHRVLWRGALSIHEIALQHHGSADPLQFLCWSEEEYAARAQPYGNGVSLRGILDQTWTGEIFCNRLRYSDWIQLVEAVGFSVLLAEPIVYLAPEAINRERFAEPFKAKSLEDLSILGVRLVARRDT